MTKELLTPSENVLLENFKALPSISLSVTGQTQHSYETGWQQISNGLNQRWKLRVISVSKTHNLPSLENMPYPT